ncbi:MAG: radical SAM protein, partial [Candidatus Omnitrophota bacterium]|nr:radical SAM protein [Candidatus Omnitrophota bacterium]
IKNSGKFKLDHDLNKIPFIDRDLTRWQLYAYKNGNYKRTPGTYIMSGRDCWHREDGGCTFCAWSLLYPQFRVRNVDNVLDEIGMLIEKYNIREVMDDTGTFPAGDWLRKFCRGMIDRGYNKKIFFDCNMRFGALTGEDFSLMKRANFRLLLFGLESANQETLDRLNKNLKVEKVIEDCRLATKAGLYPHITIMFGYPWETYLDALKTIELGKWLLKKGYAYTMQATVAIPYPGTPLFEECKQKNLLNTLDWDDYDMKSPVMKTQIENNKLMGLVQGMYKVSFQPEFILRKIFSLKDIDDLKYYLRAAKKVMGHIFDFKKGLSPQIPNQLETKGTVPDCVKQ